MRVIFEIDSAKLAYGVNKSALANYSQGGSEQTDKFLKQYRRVLEEYMGPLNPKMEDSPVLKTLPKVSPKKELYIYSNGEWMFVFSMDGKVDVVNADYWRSTDEIKNSIQKRVDNELAMKVAKNLENRLNQK